VFDSRGYWVPLTRHCGLFFLLACSILWVWVHLLYSGVFNTRRARTHSSFLECRFFATKTFWLRELGWLASGISSGFVLGLENYIFWDCIFHCMNCVLLLLLLLVGMHHGVYRFAGNFIYFYFPSVCCMYDDDYELSHTASFYYYYFFVVEKNNSF